MAAARLALILAILARALFWQLGGCREFEGKTWLEGIISRMLD